MSRLNFAFVGVYVSFYGTSDVGTIIPAMKAMPLVRAITPKARRHKASFPLHNPMLNSLSTLATKVSFTTPLAAAVVANVFNSPIAGLPSRP